MIDRVLKILENNLFGCITCNIVRIYHFDGAFIIVVAIILSWMGLCNLFHVEFSKVKRTIIFLYHCDTIYFYYHHCCRHHCHGSACATWFMLSSQNLREQPFCLYHCDGDLLYLYYHHRCCHHCTIMEVLVQPDLCFIIVMVIVAIYIIIIVMECLWCNLIYVGVVARLQRALLQWRSSSSS